MAKKTPESAQLILMQRLKDALPSNISLVDALADLLQVSNDSAYRRMRGETALSIEEISAICKHFKFSFDSFINSNDDGSAHFKYNKMDGHPDGFKAYFKSIRHDLSKIMHFDEKEVIFAAEDIPVFHHFVSPELTAFKMFYWNKSILNAKDFEDKKYDSTLIDDELKETAAAIYEMYSKVPSIEIWSDDTANSTIKQIEFYWEAGIFKSKADALLICDHVSQMLDRIKRQAELNIKLDANDKPTSAENNYALYHSDVMIGNNCVLVTTAGLKATYLSYHTFNTILTTNTAFCGETDLWLKNLIRKSNLISGVAEKQRYRYFKKIEDLMKKLRDKIESE
ncbi:MAG: hypothetical protein JWP12_1264 [Bacteroidetes bacterium]|nr:hypothetical protein [Bacteroidota bacterium]